MSEPTSTGSSWPHVPLKSVTIDVPSWDPSTRPDAKFTYVDISSIDNKACRIVEPKTLQGREAPSRARRPIREGDVLFSNVRTYLRNVAQVSGLHEPAVASTGFTLLRPTTQILSRYLYHLVRSDFFINEVTPEQTGTHYPATSDRVVRGQLIPLPSPETQDELSRLVDAVEVSRESAGQHLDAGRRAMERFRQAILAAACSGRLSADWREEHVGLEPASDLVHRSKVAAEKAGQRTGRIAARKPEYLDLPETWEWAPLGWLAAIKGGIQKQPKRAPKNNAYPFLRVANVLRGRLDLSEIHKMELFEGELATYKLEPNDLLVIEGNGSRTEIGRSAIWTGDVENCVHQNHIIRVRCMEADPLYIDLFWNSPIGSREIADLAVTSSGLYNLSVGKVSSFPVPIPPLEEQREIVRRATRMLELADGLLSRIDAASRTVERSSQAVLAKAFRGDLIPTADESA